MVHSESLSLFGNCKYFRTSWIDKSPPPPKKGAWACVQREKKGDANINPANRNSCKVHKARAAARSRERLSEVAAVWWMGFVAGSVWPRLSTPLSLNDTNMRAQGKGHGVGERACVWTAARHKRTPDDIWHKHGDVWGGRHAACGEVTAFSYRRTAKTWNRDPFPAQTVAPVGRTLAKGWCWQVTLFYSLRVLLWLDQSSSPTAHLSVV